jgi:hypothetical protein
VHFAVIRKVGATVTGLLLAAAVPAAASAAPAAPELNFPHIAVVPGGPAKIQDVYFWDADNSYTLHDVKAVIDVSQMAGVAEAKLEFDEVDENCSTDKTIFTCTFDSLAAPEGFALLTNVSYRAATDAKVGAEGSVSLKVTSRELGAITKTAKVTVAEGVSLSRDNLDIVERSAEPGATVNVPLDVRNDGENAVTGVDMFFFIDPWYGMAKHYSNCEYGTSAAYCHFDTELKAGTAYELSEPMGVKVRPDIPAPDVIGQTYRWLTPTDNRDNIDLVEAQKPERGTDGVLSLQAKPSALLKGNPQTDTSGAVSWQDAIISITGVQKADLAAVGAKVEGKQGATLTATVGVKNLGPAFVFGYPDPAAKVTVKAPTGTTVVSAPEGCVKADATYVCTTTAMPFDVDTVATWPFKLRIDKTGALTGTVSVKSSQPDGSTANDTAKLLVNPPAGAGDGDSGAGGGTGSGAGGGTESGGTGGSLPITGAPVLLISSLGALLLVGGAGAYVIGRRRARFTA